MQKVLATESRLCLVTDRDHVERVDDVAGYVGERRQQSMTAESNAGHGADAYVNWIGRDLPGELR